VVRANGERWRWQLRNTNSGGDPDLELDHGLVGQQPVTGNWDGAGGTTVGLAF
jgi:hypothetical protein